MTSELEKKFFEAFGIGRNCCNNYEKETCPAKNCTVCDYNDFPVITARILLELICLLDFNTRCGNVETLKEKILTHLRGLLSYMRQVHHIPDKENDIYKKVRTVFGLEKRGKMNHIEEMMKTAGVKPAYTYNIPDLIGVIEVDAGYIRRTRNKWSNNPRVKVTKVNKYYPDFTAEKQLELIKLIMTADDTDYLVQYYSEITKSFAFKWYSLPELGQRNTWLAVNKDYNLALAKLTTMLINSGELNKQKVKEILEQ